ncbi:MAG: hypothetical protein RL742_918, partial [Bacteroidota bacterium]
MAKRKGGQLFFNFDDERIPKLLGMFFLFLSFYLLVAFTSYFFTWENDHDIVFHFSWEMFFDNIQVDNWLGRLGAILADSIIYWGFGVSSFGFIYLLYKYGLALIRGIPLIQMAPVLQRTAIWMVIVSVVSAFFLQQFEFPVGGVFGREIALWLQNLLGIIGTLALLLFCLLATFVYSNNPNLDDFTWHKLLYETKQAWRDLLNGNYGKRRPVVAPPPRNRTRSVPAEEAEAELPELELPIPASEVETAPGSQLSFDLTKRSALFEDGGPGDKKSPGGPAELEINMPVQPEPPVTPDEAPVYKPPVELVQEDNPQLSEPYDPTLELSHYEYPHLQLLNEYDQQTLEVDREELEANKNQIIQTLLYFKIEIEKIRATIGPTVTLYEIIPARGIRISKIKNLEDDIALNLSALGIRIIAPIPGKGTIGIEVPNKNRQIVGMREVLMSDKFRRAKMELPIALGKTISNEVFVA